MFEFLRPKRSDDRKALRNLVSGYAAHQSVLGHLSRSQSFEKLGRTAEAAAAKVEAKTAALRHAKQNPSDAQAQLLYAVYLVESQSIDEALVYLPAMLARKDLRLTAEARSQVEAELFAIRRQHPARTSAPEAKEGFTTVYTCQSCGRLHNYVSLPCPHCGWHPETLNETARAVVMSTFHAEIPLLLSVSRAIQSGRPAEQVVGNLLELADGYLKSPGHRKIIEDVFNIAQEDSGKTQHRIEPLRQCASCGARIMYSHADVCTSCKSEIELPDILRLLVCADNLLWLLEHRIECSKKPEFSEFVSVLVAFVNEILRRQSEPSCTNRKHGLDILRTLKVLADVNQGAVVSLKNDDSLEIHVIKDRATDESQTYGVFIYHELSAFIKYMKVGVSG